MKMPALPRNDIPLMVRFLKYGWVRCVIILVPFMILSGVITSKIELTIDRTLPSLTDSVGYSLLSGLNKEAAGESNQQDMDILNGAMERTGSASGAHIICRDQALQRLSGDPVEILDLLVGKYENLWENDDYSFDMNFTYLNEQKQLTWQRSDILYAARDADQIIYVMVIFLALIASFYVWRGEPELSFMFSESFVLVSIVYLLLESQNRYHYFMLEIFMLLAGVGVRAVYMDEKRRKKERQREAQRDLVQQQEEEHILLQFKEKEDKVSEYRKEAFENVFDMEKALKEGHIIMTVSEAYGTSGKPEESKEPEKPVELKEPEESKEPEKPEEPKEPEEVKKPEEPEKPVELKEQEELKEPEKPEEPKEPEEVKKPEEPEKPAELKEQEELKEPEKLKKPEELKKEDEEIKTWDLVIPENEKQEKAGFFEIEDEEDLDFDYEIVDETLLEFDLNE